jgi:hypothetical protein
MIASLSRTTKIIVLSLGSLVVLTACTELYVHPPVVKLRQDMDSIISSRGIPRRLQEDFYSGAALRQTLTLYYADAVYTFQTDQGKTYTVMTNQSTVSFSASELKQEPLPLWFRTKYPNLNWSGVPVR